MDDSFEQVEERELYNQFGVYHGNCKNHFSTEHIGTLSLFESKKDKQIYIEWRPATEAKVEPDTQESDWTVISTQAKKARTLSTSSAETAATCLVSEIERERSPMMAEPERSPEMVESTSRRRHGRRIKEVRRARNERRSHPRPGRSRHSRCHSEAEGQIDSSNRGEAIRIPLSTIGSFRLNRRRKSVSLKLREEKKPSTYFTFSPQDGSLFITQLCLYTPAIRHHRDPNLYTVYQDNDEERQKLAKSFSQLNLDHHHYSPLWGLVGQIRENPYEAAMGAFSKITDTFLYRGEQKPEEVSKLLTQSLTVDDADELRRTETATSSDEYEVIQSPVVIDLDKCVLQPRGPPLTLERWTQGMDADGRIIDPKSIKKLVFRGGVAHELRVEVWKFLLGVYPWDSTHSERGAIRAKNVESYYIMKRQWESFMPGQEERFSDFRDRKSLIGKDVHRTDRALPFFAGDDNPNVEALMRILMTYVFYNFDLGYVQGMSDLLAPVLELFNNEVDAFWCFVGFMDRVGSNFDMDQEGMKQQLLNVRTLIAFLDPNLLNYLDRNDSGNMFFCFRWLIVLFKREFGRDDVMRIWEVLWSDLPCQNFQLLFCVAVLETEKKIFYENNFSFNEILKHVNELSMRINLEEMLSKAEGIYKLLIDKADELPDCVRVILGLPPLNLQHWGPPSLPLPGSQPEERMSPTQNKNPKSPQANNVSTAGEAAPPKQASLYPELPPDDFI